MLPRFLYKTMPVTNVEDSSESVLGKRERTQECLDGCSERLIGSVSVSTVAYGGECRSAMLPPLLQPPRALYNGSGLHD